MATNLDRYEKDLDALIMQGKRLTLALDRDLDRAGFDKRMEEILKDKAKALLDVLPEFKEAYQGWYSEAKAVMRQLLPDRADDFARLFEKPKARKELNYGNYSLEDALEGVTLVREVTREEVLGPKAAAPKLKQQVAMVTGAKRKFQSSLFDIRQLLQADIFDSELDAAQHLLKSKFARAAGALAGVVLERHLGEVVSSHDIALRKKDPSIADLNDALKAAETIDMAQWRFI